jgi:hypothetical protein
MRGTDRESVERVASYSSRPTHTRDHRSGRSRRAAAARRRGGLDARLQKAYPGSMPQRGDRGVPRVHVHMIAEGRTLEKYTHKRRADAELRRNDRLDDCI